MVVISLKYNKKYYQNAAGKLTVFAAIIVYNYNS